jgi:dTDP-4-dehydrorhamnose 3,5-epimerase
MSVEAERSRVAVGSLAEGAFLRRLSRNVDPRGALTEIYRAEWGSGAPALQWNFVRSLGAVLRGVRVHFHHDDHLVVLDGSVAVGLRDLRPGSPTEGTVALVELRGSDPALLKTPAGVAHGLFFRTAGSCVIGITAFHDDADENPFRWDDPALGIPWPFSSPMLCDRDASAPGLDAVLPGVPRWRPAP